MEKTDLGPMAPSTFHSMNYANFDKGYQNQSASLEKPYDPRNKVEDLKDEAYCVTGMLIVQLEND